MPCSALILAAGVGSRLMPLTAERPKALVEVAGRTLLAHLLEACADAGLDDAVVVTGYRHDAVTAWLADHPAPLPTRCLRNDAYERFGNAYSVSVARPLLQGRSFIKLDGDLLLAPSILLGLRDATGSTIALDRRAPVDAEAMKATLDGGRVTGLGKGIALAAAAGESIGAERIAAEDGPALFERIEALIRDQPGIYYEDAYHALVTEGWPLAWHDVAAPWVEIDDHADLARAEALFGSG